LGEIKVSENCIKRYNREIMQLFGDLDILSFVRINRLNWIGYVNSRDSARKVSKVIKTILREVD